MNLTAVILLTCSISVCANGISQTVTFSGKEVPLQKVFSVIEKQTNLFVFYEEKLLENSKPVTADIQNVPLETFLNTILKDQLLDFVIKGKTIFITERTVRAAPFAPETKPVEVEAPPISGVVRNASGEALSGVSVMVKGTNSGVVTDETGNFTITAPDNNAILVFSYIGFVSREVSLQGKALLDIVLEAEDKSMKDVVVVVGYGQQRSRNVTSAVSTVRGQEIIKSPVANISNSLAGRVTGLTFNQPSGLPGADATTLYIRGLGTTGDVSILFVIDGIPRTNADFNRLAPGDIESISVLKDAASAAVFGARGANGVILVTTKRGTTGRATFTYTFNYGIQKPTRLPDFVNAFDYVTLVNEASNSDGNGDIYTAEEIEKFRDGKNNVDWIDSAFSNSAPMQQHNLTVSGGTEKARYFVSLNYLDQKGLFPTTFAKRYNFRSNIDAQVTNTTKVSFDVSGIAAMNEEPGRGTYSLIGDLYRELSITPISYGPGLYAGNRFNINAISYITETGYRRRNNNSLLSRVEIKQEIPFIKGLAIKGIAAYDYYINKEKDWVKQAKLYQPAAGGGYEQSVGGKPALAETWTNNHSITMEAHAMYNRTFGKHAVNALLLYTRQQYKTNFLYGSRDNFLSEELEILSVGQPGPSQLATGGADQSNREGVVGRVGYIFSDKYLAEANFRYDASDMFASGHRGGFFPSASIGWIISEENFLRSANFLDYLKIRASYGELGNDRIGGPQYLDFFQFAGNAVLGVNSSAQEVIALSRMANPNITWETVTKMNIGFEATVFGGLSIEADYFDEKRTNILGQRTGNISATTGIIGGLIPFENFAKVNNKGFELSIGYQKAINQNLNIFARFNVTHAKNTIIDIAESENLDERLRQTGRSLYSQFGLVSEGYFQTQKEIEDFFGPNYADYSYVKPGDIRYKDLDSDQQITGDDRTYIGNINLPTNIYGFSAGATFKGFEVSMLWQAGTGNQQQLGYYIGHPFYNANPPLNIHKDHWTPSNPNAAFPRLTFLNGGWNFAESDFWLNDTRYLRLKNAEVAYTFPKSFTNKFRSQGLRLYANGANLLTFTKFTQIDPENNSFEGKSYPQQIVINVGAQLTF